VWRVWQIRLSTLGGELLMRHLLRATAVAVALFLMSGVSADAKSHSTGQHASKFRTSACKTSSCKAKHPSGKWVHPITPRKKR
jgi:hypothetical protein